MRTEVIPEFSRLLDDFRSDANDNDRVYDFFTDAPGKHAFQSIQGLPGYFIVVGPNRHTGFYKTNNIEIKVSGPIPEQVRNRVPFSYCKDPALKPPPNMPTEIATGFSYMCLQVIQTGDAGFGVVDGIQTGYFDLINFPDHVLQMGYIRLEDGSMTLSRIAKYRIGKISEWSSHRPEEVYSLATKLVTQINGIEITRSLLQGRIPFKKIV